MSDVFRPFITNVFIIFKIRKHSGWQWAFAIQDESRVKERKRVAWAFSCHGGWFRHLHRCIFLEKFKINWNSCTSFADLPATKRRFTSDILYPLPDNSKSMPDNVVPSQLNCVVRIDGVDGPLAISSRARNVSIPLLSECCEMSVKFHTSLFDSPSLKKFFNSLKSLMKIGRKTYHAECGFDCTFLTPPSTGTEIDTFSTGDGDAIEWLLYL